MNEELCPLVFKSKACGYVGPAASCDKRHCLLGQPPEHLNARCTSIGDAMRAAKAILLQPLESYGDPRDAIEDDFAERVHFWWHQEQSIRRPFWPNFRLPSDFGILDQLVLSNLGIGFGHAEADDATASTAEAARQ